MTYSIGEFAKLVGLSIDTLRYYEQEDLITPARNAGDRRVYSDADAHWIAVIKRLKLAGMSIRDIQLYAHLRAEGDETIDQRLTLLLSQQKRLLAKRDELDGHIAFLENKIQTYRNLQHRK